METTIIYWGCIRSSSVFWVVEPSYIGIMEKKMETTIMYWVYIRVILGLYSRVPRGYIGIL